MIASTEPQFLYPKSRQYPFDQVCEQIVRSLEERGWDVPGLTINFDVYGGEAEKYRLVRSIVGDDFVLHFGRPQGRLGRYNDTAAISDIKIPRKEIHVYEDNSGPSLYVYVGRNWAKDKQRFFGSLKVNSKLHGEPRLYLWYKGGCNCQSARGASFEATGLLTATLAGDAKALAAMSHTHPGRLAPLLIANSDLGREYSPKGNEPVNYTTEEVFAEFTQYLRDTVLRMILATPLVSP